MQLNILLTRDGEDIAVNIETEREVPLSVLTQAAESALVRVDEAMRTAKVEGEVLGRRG